MSSVPARRGPPHGQETRTAILDDIRAGATIKGAAKARGVPPNTAGNWARAAGLGRYGAKPDKSEGEKTTMREGMPAMKSFDTDDVAQVGPNGRYDAALKKRAIKELRAGVHVRDVAENHKVKLKTVEQWAWQFRPRRRKKSSSAKKASRMDIKSSSAPVAMSSGQPKPRVTSQQVGNRTLFAGFIVSSEKSPGGLLDDAKSLLDRLVKEARNGSNS